MLMYQADEADFKYHCIGWQLKYSLKPRYCFYTGKRIWLTYAYKGTAMWTGPDLPVFEHRWVSKNHFLIKKLKGEL